MSTSFRESFSGFMNYEIESLSSAIYDINSFELFGPVNYELSGPTNYELSGPMNYELSGPANYELSGPSHYGLSRPSNYELSGPSNYGLSSSVNYGSSGPTSYELPSSVNIELPDLELPDSTNLVLPGSTNLELSSSTNSEITEFTNYLSSPGSSGFGNNANVNDNQTIQYDKNKSILRVRVYLRRRDYICWKFGVNKPKKVEDVCAYYNSVSGKTNCLWIVHFYFGKCVSHITISSMVNEYNHICNSDTIELAPKNLQFPQEILDKIKSYTIIGWLDAGQQYDLLAKEFS
ncbi:25235_t:CDS:2 [Gigaspora margarita]|uniref:25235_t:CDS:1 n=1 Tax=Gigaspora margarita TaxID=4874 RepID=A0ABN7VPS4_GIGMA|nr:25235_t:CDS:2 [Gigaspora margarita]